jgi:Cyclic nucleotide-binding domain
MLAKADLAQDFTVLNQQYQRLVEALLDVVGIAGVRVDVDATDEGNFFGFDGAMFYVVASGSIAVRYQGRAVCQLEPGDILLPDATGVSDPDAAVFYGSETGATLDSYPALEFMSRVFSDPTAVKLWTRLLITYTGMMTRIAASRIGETALASPGFEVYEPGEVIILQGERADFVFNMSEGAAEVLVEDVAVGRIGEGEIFGAMAALTHGDRSATVRALTRCSVVKVPKDQFGELIRNHPETIHSLLVDMANSVVNLNQQLVGLSHE